MKILHSNKQPMAIMRNFMGFSNVYVIFLKHLRQQNKLCLYMTRKMNKCLLNFSFVSLLRSWHLVEG